MKNKSNTTKIILTDFFNTVVFRDKSPKDVIYDFSVTFGEKLSIEPSVIYKAFIKSKNKLAVSRFLKTREAEYTFSEITEGALPYFKSSAEEKENIINQAEKIYADAELKSFYLNEEHIEKLKAFKEQGLKIYIVSDFYCKKEVFSYWLKKLNIDGIFDGIFVSCDYNKSKRTGKLYREVIKELKADPKEILMTGDSKKSDVIKAKRNKIPATKTQGKSVKESKDLKYRVKYGANAILYKEIFEENPECRFSNFAYPLYLFTKRLCEALEKNGVENALFCSREGWFLKSLFDEYVSVTGKGKNINTHYFYVSRNSVALASLNEIDDEKFDKIANGVLFISGKKFLTTLDFNEKEIEQIQKEIDKDFEKGYWNFSKSQLFRQIIKNPDFISIYEYKRNLNKQGFRSYVNSMGIDFYKEGMTMIDIGWAGTIQDFVEKFVSGRYDLRGFYLGARDKRKSDRKNKTGILYSRKKKDYAGHKFFHHHMAYYEQVCRADHAHVSGYYGDNDCYNVILGIDSNSERDYKTLIKPMQDLIKAKFIKLCKLDYDGFSQAENQMIKYNYKMLIKPTEKDHEWLIKCENTHYDSFIRIGYSFHSVKTKLRLWFYKTENFFFRIKYAAFVRSRKVRLKKNGDRKAK